MNYYTKKFGYTNNKSFSLSGNYYTGYYNILSGVGYVSKNLQQQTLVSNNTYYTDVVVSDLLFDRAANDVLTLPYNTINIPLNEFVTARVLNDIFYKINFNNIYLYSKCFIVSNLIPFSVESAIGIISPDNNTLVYETNTVTNFEQFSASDRFFELGKINTSALALYNENQNFTLYACSSSTVNILTGSFTDASVDVADITQITRDDLQNSFKFSNIQDCVVYNNILYIADAGNQSVYRYDVKELQDNLTLGRRIYVESIGNQYTNKSSLKYPKYLAVDSINSRLVIYDVFSQQFNITDLDFNILNILKLLRRNETVQAIQYNNFYNKFYVISSIDDILYINIFDENFNKLEFIQLPETLYPGERILRLKFSENNSNIFYFATNYRVIKKILSNPDKKIGTFLTDKLELQGLGTNTNAANLPVNYSAFDLAGTSNDYDLILLQNSGRVMLIKDNSTFSHVTFSTSLSNYNYSTFKLTNDEYVQANYINKELYKLLKNVLILKNDISGKFNLTPASESSFIRTISGVEYESIMVLNGYTYIKNYNYLALDSNAYNFFLHENERVTPLSMNRCLENIYKLQLQLLDATQVFLSDSLVQYVSGNNGINGPLILA